MRSVLIVTFLVVLSLASGARAQQPYDGNQNLPPFGSFHGSDFDIVSLQNGSLHLGIPVLTVPQRGKALSWTYLYDTHSWSKVWVPQPTPTNPKAGSYFVRDAGQGWFLSTPFSWVVSSPSSTVQCPTQQFTVYQSYVAADPEGQKHPLPLYTGNPGVTVCGQTNSGPALDGSGIWASYDLPTGNITLTLKDGTRVGATRKDSNGNLATSSADTLNRNLLVVTNAPNVTYVTPLGKSIVGPQSTLWTTADTNGNPAIYRLDYQAIDVQTSFCTPGFTCHELSKALLVPSTLTLPNAKMYQFAWINNSAGELQQVTLPIGGSVAYTYQNSCMTSPGQGGNPTSDCRRAVLTRTVTQNSASATWTYAGGTVTDPNGNDEVHSFSSVVVGAFSSPGRVEKQVKKYSGSSTAGTLLHTVVTDYTGEVGPMSPTAVINVRPIRTTSTLDNGIVQKAETDYETFTATGPNGSFTATRLNATEKREYDFGSGSPTLLRRTDYTYQHTGNQNYISRNIVDRVVSTTVFNGSSTQVANTVNEYDNYSHANQSMQASSAIQHDATYGTAFIYRGNVTATQRWLNTNGTFLTTTNQYDDAGNLISSIDPLGHKTTFDFTDSWTNTACAPSGAGKAYVTRVTNALNQATNNSYYSCSGLLGSTTDANNQQTSFQYDALSRPTRITFPLQGTLNGVTNYIYTDTVGSLNVEKTKTIDASRSTDEFFYYDGLGRLMSHSLANDQATPWDKADTCYDSVGRKSFSSYPYQASSATAAQVCSGLGDSFSYDALNRVTQVSHSDGTSVSTTYTGRATDVQDEGNGSQRVDKVSQSDALGRLVSVCEATSATLVGLGGIPVACGQDIAKTGFLTTYGYDTLGNLTGVTQAGLNPRSFSYDSLSRLVTDTNPETGTTTYTYDSDSNVYQRTRPAPNQTNPSVTVTTTFSYDALHRPAQKSYSDTVPVYANGTPTALFGYDLSTLSMGTTNIAISNSIGRISWSSTVDQNTLPITKGAYSYDSMGRELQFWQCTTINCPAGRQTQYTYDLISDLTSASNGVGTTLTYSYNRAQRLLTGSSSLADANHPGTMLSGLQYNAFGSPLQSTLGNGVAESYTYTPRGWMQSVTAIKTSTTVYSLNMTNPANGQTGYSPNGNVLNAQDSVNGSWTYTYDALNRLVTAGKSGQAFSYVYDRFGNRWQQNVTLGTGPSPSYSFDANNRIVGSGVVYDAAGNVINDGSHTYAYDAENRIVKVDGGATATYTYDADGNRVHKVTGSTAVDDVFDVAGHLVAEVNSSGSWTRAEVYAEGHHLATYSPGTTYFSHADWLGTERVRSNVTGAACETITSLAYGDGQATSGSCGDPSPLHFTGKLHDAETGLDDFPARYYSSVQGRWYSPDWSPVPVAIPYVNLGDPRTLNLYAYVGDDPTNHPDADGHVTGTAALPPTSPCSSDTVPCTGQAYSPEERTQAENGKNQANSIGDQIRSSSRTVDNFSGGAGSIPPSATVWPADSHVVTDTFNSTTGRNQPHNGVDIRDPKGGNVYSSDDGTVTNVFFNNRGGNQILVLNADGSQSGYAHTSAMVKKSDTVNAGQVIGHSDASGHNAATGKPVPPHLHYTWRPHPTAPYQNPLKHLPPPTP